MSFPDPRYYDSPEKLKGDIKLLWVLVAFLFLSLVCAKPNPGPQPGDSWRRCEDECGQGVFLLDFGAEPPTCHCVEVPQ